MEQQSLHKKYSVDCVVAHEIQHIEYSLLVAIELLHDWSYRLVFVLQCFPLRAYATDVLDKEKIIIPYEACSYRCAGSEASRITGFGLCKYSRTVGLRFVNWLYLIGSYSWENMCIIRIYDRLTAPAQIHPAALASQYISSVLHCEIVKQRQRLWLRPVAKIDKSGS